MFFKLNTCTTPQIKQENLNSAISDTDMQTTISDNAIDHNDLDFYTLQFFH